MPQRTARIAQTYAGRPIAVGDRFEVEPPHVSVLLAMGRIEPEAGDFGYRARAMTAEAAVGYQTKELKPRARRAAVDQAAR